MNLCEPVWAEGKEHASRTPLTLQGPSSQILNISQHISLPALDARGGKGRHVKNIE
jgi:hypothetical protein